MSIELISKNDEVHCELTSETIDNLSKHGIDAVKEMQSPSNSITVVPMENQFLLKKLWKDSMDSDNEYTLEDLNGAPKFFATVKNWDEFDELIKSSKFEDNIGYIILKSDSQQYFGRSGTSWIDISESYRM